MVHALVSWSIKLFSECMDNRAFLACQGATGYDGVFHKSCEITMKLMRTECDTLLWYIFLNEVMVLHLLSSLFYLVF